jgi:hypothetical protein
VLFCAIRSQKYKNASVSFDLSGWLMAFPIKITIFKTGKMKNLERYQKVGWFIILFNLWWIWFNGQLFYKYHYTSLLFIYMHPDWVLGLNIILAILGVFIGIKVLRRKMTERPALKIAFGILLLGFLVGQFVSW